MNESNILAVILPILIILVASDVMLRFTNRLKKLTLQLLVFRKKLAQITKKSDLTMLCIKYQHAIRWQEVRLKTMLTNGRNERKSEEIKTRNDVLDQYNRDLYYISSDDISIEEINNKYSDYKDITPNDDLEFLFNKINQVEV